MTTNTDQNEAAQASCAPAAGSAPLALGKYMLNHYRFGRATVKVTRSDETWADCEILSGTLRGMGRGAVWEAGGTKTVRIEHGVWTRVQSDGTQVRAERARGLQD